MQFSLFFRESAKFLSFEAPSVGTMWTVISALTRACSSQPKESSENQETHKWAHTYAQLFKLTDKQTNCVIVQQQVESTQVSDAKKKWMNKRWFRITAVKRSLRWILSMWLL
jgi:hypothetical protein